MSVNLILIPPALENGKEITAPRSQKNDLNSNQPINSCTTRNSCTNHNNFLQKLCQQANTANNSIYKSSIINVGGVA